MLPIQSFSPAQEARVVELLRAGVSRRAIPSKVDFPIGEHHIRQFRIKHDITPPKPLGFTDAIREALVSELVAGGTYKGIAAKLGLATHSAKSYVRRLTPEQRAERERNVHKNDPDHAVIAAELVAGDKAEDIAKRHGIRVTTVYNYVTTLLAPEQRLARSRKRPKASAVESVAWRPTSDPLYSRINAAMPRWISPSLREDAVSDVYIAVLSGEIEASDVAKAAQRFASRAVEQFESRYGPRSLDAPMFDDSERTLADTIADPSALEAFDHIFA